MSHLKRLLSSCRRDPVLAAFLVFAVSVTVFSYGAPRSIRETVIPFTGWNPAAMYSFSVFFAILALLKPDRRIRNTILLFPLLQLAFGLVEWLIQGARASENPYLRISAWRPVWSVLAPALWLAMLSFLQPARPSQSQPE